MLNQSSKARRAAAAALLAMAAAWPSFFSALSFLVATPYERALRSAWCGGPSHDLFVLLGHCPSCWIGAALLAGAAFALWNAPRAAAAKRLEKSHVT